MGQQRQDGELLDQGSLAHQTVRIAGPVGFLHPTTRYVVVPTKTEERGHDHGNGDGNVEDEESGHGKSVGAAEREERRQQSFLTPATDGRFAYHIWRSRDNRKGRHALLVSRRFFESREGDGRGGGGGGGGGDGERQEEGGQRLPSILPPRASNRPSAIMAGLGKMATCFPWFDVSFDVAMLFTFGSAIWVINAFFVWLPVVRPSLTFAHEETTAAAVVALVGAAVFEVGAVLGLLEAVNENRTACFGWALEEAEEALQGRLEEKREERDRQRQRRQGTTAGFLRLRARPSHCRHHQADRHRFWGVKSSDDLDKSPDDIQMQNGSKHNNNTRSWSWCPSWQELRTHYLREIGFWACLIQLVAATIFWIAGFTGLPPIYDRLDPPAAVDGLYWLPQVVGGVGFVVSSLLFMLETQPRWYRPALGLLGWHIGFWNLVGSMGFLLCGAFGFAAANSHSMTYASTLSTFIGSWAFLIGSVIQWYESLDKYPVSYQDSLPGEKTSLG